MKIETYETPASTRILMAVSYVGFLWIIPLFIKKKKEPDCIYHGKQGMVIFFFWAVLLYLGWIIGWPILLLAPILIFINIFAIWQALKGRTWRIPVIRKIADKIGYLST